MADITDPQIVHYCENYLRPFAERLRGTLTALQEATAEYAANVNGLLGPYSGADVVVDGPSAAGAGTIRKLDINRMRLYMDSIQAAMESTAQTVVPVQELLAVFTVRPSKINE